MERLWNWTKSLRWRGRLLYQRTSRLWLYRFYDSRPGKICRRVTGWPEDYGRKASTRGVRISLLSSLREIGSPDLLATWLGLPEILRNDTQISTLILKHFLSEEWVFKHLDPEAICPGPLTLAGDPKKMELAKIRVVDLAESIFNLQKIPNVLECINRLRTANEIEPFVAELHIAKMIFANGWPFSFVVPEPPRTYDFEVQYGEWNVAADAKYKSDSPVPDRKGITNALGRNRKQLPKDGPGIFFVKLP